MLIIHFRCSRKRYLETNINFKNSQSVISQPEDKQLTGNIDLLKNEVAFKMIIEYYYKFYTFHQHSHFFVFYSVYEWVLLFIFMAWFWGSILMKPPSILSKMLLAGHTKALYTFYWLRAEVYTYSIS